MSESTVVAVIITAIILLVVTLITLRRVQAERKRARAVKEWAESTGWEYSSTDVQLANELSGLQFERGIGGKALNVSKRKTGDLQEIFVDYRQLVEGALSSDDTGNKTTKSIPFTVVGISIGGSRPDIAVVPRKQKSRTVGLRASVRFPSGNTDFDKNFSVSTRSPEQVSAVLTPAVLEYSCEYPHFAWAVAGRWLITWVAGNMPLMDTSSRLPYLQGLAARLQ